MARSLHYASTPIVPGMTHALKVESGSPQAPDVFHLHFPYPWGEVAWLRARVSQPTVLAYHADVVRQKMLLAMYAPMLRRVLDRVDVVLASSPNMVEHSPFLSRIPDKCRVIPYGIHVERYADTPELLARAAELRAGHERPIVLFVGRLVYYKGPEVLMRAMGEVDADLVVIGRGPLRPELEALAESSGITSRVTFLDPVDDDELAAWYHAADVFCLPSVARSEAYGLVQLEAHASGTPTISTTLTTSVPFVNADGVTGLTVSPGDAGALTEALRTLVGDEALRTRLGAQARERARADFSIDRMVDRTLAVYAELGVSV
jgi:rhamnosyl/mannosyltransferase